MEVEAGSEFPPPALEEQNPEQQVEVDGADSADRQSCDSASTEAGVNTFSRGMSLTLSGTMNSGMEVADTDMISSGLQDLGRSADGTGLVYRELVLADRGIAKLGSAIQAFKMLQRVDLCHNCLQTLQPLSCLPHMSHLDASHNALHTILDFAPRCALKEANLSHNEIGSMRDLSAFRFLQHLDLSDNQITEISGLQGCGLLVSLNLDNNKLVKVENLEGLPLKELSICGNEVTSVSSVWSIQSLDVLRASHNKLSELQGASGAQSLRALDVAFNQAISLDSFEELRSNVRLAVLCLEGTAASSSSCWRLKMLHKLPWLERIDSTDVTPEEAVSSHNFFDDSHPQYMDEKRDDAQDLPVNLFNPFHIDQVSAIPASPSKAG